MQEILCVWETRTYFPFCQYFAPIVLHSPCGLSRDFVFHKHGSYINTCTTFSICLAEGEEKGSSQQCSINARITHFPPMIVLPYIGLAHAGTHQNSHWSPPCLLSWAHPHKSEYDEMTCYSKKYNVSSTSLLQTLRRLDVCTVMTVLLFTGSFFVLFKGWKKPPGK